MNNQQILEKAIKKAIDGGWINYEDFKPVDLGAGDVGLEYGDSAVVLPSCMIFQHQFAKALWGESEELLKTDNMTVLSAPGFPAWKHHIMMMVIADDPIQYLGEHLDG